MHFSANIHSFQPANYANRQFLPFLPVVSPGRFCLSFHTPIRRTQRAAIPVSTA